jgi:hypothetical protein
MNKVERDAVEFYNSVQKRFYVDRIKNGEVHIMDYEENKFEKIGIYQFIFITKYKVLEVFEVDAYEFLELKKSETEFSPVKIKQPEEILTYLADRSIE